MAIYPLTPAMVKPCSGDGRTVSYCSVGGKWIGSLIPIRRNVNRTVSLHKHNTIMFYKSFAAAGWGIHCICCGLGIISMLHITRGTAGTGKWTFSSCITILHRVWETTLCWVTSWYCVTALIMATGGGNSNYNCITLLVQNILDHHFVDYKYIAL